MPFEVDEQLAAEVGQYFGEYETTFYSAHDQVRADIFKHGDELVAHVWFPTGLQPWEVTDPYLSALQRFAKENGYDDRLRMVVSSS